MQNKKGFTLIELLVVIAIIAVLMAILMPALNKAREQGQRIVCKSNLKNYTLAIQMYADDNDDRFCVPQSCYFSQTAAYPVEAGLSSPIHLRWCNGDLYLREHPEYASNFFHYLQNVKAFICPTFKRITIKSSQDHFYVAFGTKRMCLEPDMAGLVYFQRHALEVLRGFPLVKYHLGEGIATDLGSITLEALRKGAPHPLAGLWKVPLFGVMWGY